jgi:hypothetical protein
MKYTKNTLEKLADDVISVAKTRGDSLVNAVLSILKDNPMNPEQIRRLVEMTNTSKFLDEFANTAGEDRFVDFDVLDPEDIIQKVLGDLGKGSVVDSKSKSLSVRVERMPGGTLVTKKERNDPGLDTEDSQFFADVDDTKEKAAFFSKIAKQDLSFTDEYDESPALKGKQKDLPDETQEKILKSKGKELAENNKKKMSPHDEKIIEEKLHTKKESSSLACDDLATAISRRFRGIYSREKHASFEMEALANYGLDALPALQAVRIKLGKEKLVGGSVTEQQVKQASERYLCDRTSLGMPEVAKYIEKMGQYIDACLELDSFYSYTEKTAAMPLLGAALPAVGLGIAGGSLLDRPMGTTSYVLNKRIHNWADRIEARDETLKDIRKRVVGFALDGLENKADDFFGSRRDAETQADQKKRRMLAAKTMFKNNPDLRAAGKQNAMMAINMVGKVAPELSTSVPFLTAHVKQMVYNSEGGTPVIDAQSIKSMSDAERAFENLGEFKPA